MQKDVKEVVKWCSSVNDKIYYQESGLIDLDKSKIYFDVTEDVWGSYFSYMYDKFGVDLNLFDSMKDDFKQRMNEITKLYSDGGRAPGAEEFNVPLNEPSDGSLFLRYMLQFAGYAAGFAATLWLIRKVRSMIIGDEGKDEDFEVVSPVAEGASTSPQPNMERRSSLVKRAVRYPGVKAAAVVGQAGVSKARVLRFKADKFRFWAIGVRDDYYLTFSHIEHVLDLSKDIELKAEFGGAEIDCKMLHSSIVGVESKDFIIFRVVGKLGFSPAITSAFITTEEAGRFAKSSSGWNITATLHDTELQSIARYSSVYSYCLPTTFERVEFVDGFIYPAHSREGDCGTPLIATVGDAQKILGIHVAGQGYNYGKRGFVS